MACYRVNFTFTFTAVDNLRISEKAPSSFLGLGEGMFELQPVTGHHREDDKGDVVPVHAMKARTGSSGMAVLILTVGAR
jgi:hypothetical protein